jgi:hypothetical protein
MDAVPEIYCDKHIRQFRFQMRLHFECTLIPVTAATEIHRSQKKPVSSRSTTGLLAAAVAGAILNRE